MYSTAPRFSHKHGCPGKRVKLSKPAFKELLFWANLTLASCTEPLCSPRLFSFLYTDASERGWGAVLQQPGESLTIHGLFPPTLDCAHIGVKELFAIIRGLECFSAHLTDTTLVLFCDNLPAVHMLKRFATKSRACISHVAHIFSLLKTFRIVLDIKWIASANNVADLPSRRLLPHVYNEPSWFAQFVRTRLSPTLHLFAGQQ